jgi:5-methylcytosine-specific restriction endonuclease McrA
MALAKRCLGCHRRTRNGSYCTACAPYNNRSRRARARATIAASPRCERCGATRDLTADHIVPVSEGGTHGPLRVLCRRCNTSRGSSPVF